MLGVYSPAQATALTEGDITTPLLILMPVRQLPEVESLYRMARCGNLHLTVHDRAQMGQLNDVGRTLGCRLPVHLHLDTGMSRAGLTGVQLAELIATADTFAHLRLAGLCTHFASADDDPVFTDQQMAAFAQAMATHRRSLPADLIAHAANTFATCRGQRFHLSMVRVGLGLFGYGPSTNRGADRGEQGPTFKPIVRWLTHLVHVQRYGQGAAVGYNRSYQLARDSVLGIVPVGYGDGYPLALGNRASVEVVCKSGPCFCAPVRGKVNMDQLIIDLTDAPAEAQQVGAMVVLMSNDPQSPCALHRLADLAGSNCYEMLCRLSGHLPRRYLEKTPVKAG